MYDINYARHLVRGTAPFAAYGYSSSWCPDTGINKSASVCAEKQHKSELIYPAEYPQNSHIVVDHAYAGVDDLAPATQREMWGETRVTDVANICRGACH